METNTYLLVSLTCKYFCQLNIVESKQTYIKTSNNLLSNHMFSCLWCWLPASKILVQIKVSLLPYFRSFDNSLPSYFLERKGRKKKRKKKREGQREEREKERKTEGEKEREIKRKRERKEGKNISVTFSGSNK